MTLVFRIHSSRMSAEYFSCNFLLRSGTSWQLRKCILKSCKQGQAQAETDHQLVFPSTICLATSNGNFTPLISNSVTLLMASMQASNGDKHTYHPAQKNPTGQPMNHKTRNQMIAHNTFMLFWKPFLLPCYKKIVKKNHLSII